MKIGRFIMVLIAATLTSSLSAQDRMQDEEILELIRQMSLEEKVNMMHGHEGRDREGVPFVGYMPGLKRLGIPPMGLQNGPSGAGASFGSHRHKKTGNGISRRGGPGEHLEYRPSAEAGDRDGVGNQMAGAEYITWPRH
jgi:hypothetical protein